MKTPDGIPLEILDLVRFLCDTYRQIDVWAYKHCSSDALIYYPVVQGTRNQINLTNIGLQHYDPTKIKRAVEWMLESGGLAGKDGGE